MNIAISPTVEMRPRGVALTPLLDIVRCAHCGGRLAEADGALACRGCTRSYAVSDGIPQLFVPSDRGGANLTVADPAKELCEETPFPTYDGLDSRESLQTKLRLDVLARL